MQLTLINFDIGDRVEILSSFATGTIKRLSTTFAVVSLDPEFTEKEKLIPEVKVRIVKYNNLKALK